MSTENYIMTDPLICHYNFDLSKKWFIYFDISNTETEQVTRKQFRGPINKATTVEDRIKLANALIAYWKKEFKHGWTGSDESAQLIYAPTIIEAIDYIMSIKESSCRERTIHSYKSIMKQFKAWVVKARLHNTKVARFDSMHAQAFVDSLSISGKYNNRTWNDKLRAVSTFYNEMVEREWIEKNPFKKIKRKNIEIGRNIAYSDAEKIKLERHLKEHDPDMYYFTRFIYYCFIRRSELVRLKIENIDWKYKSIVIPSSVSKNRKQESVVIPNSFMPILEEMNLQNLSPNLYIFGRRMKPGPAIYKNYNHISSRHNTVSKNLGIDTQKGLYSWKHSGVCALYNVLAGDIYALMRQLRHSDLKTTQIYLKSLGLTDNTAIRNASW